MNHTLSVHYAKKLSVFLIQFFLIIFIANGTATLLDLFYISITTVISDLFKQDRWIMMESKWPQRTCREAVIDTFVQEKFKPPVKTKIMMILLVRFVQTR